MGIGKGLSLPAVVASAPCATRCPGLVQRGWEGRERSWTLANHRVPARCGSETGTVPVT